MRIKVKIYKIDSWVNETIFCMIDGVTVKLFTWNETTGTTDLCGNPTPIPDSINKNYNDTFVNIDVVIPHSNPSINLTFISNLNSAAGAWGIR